MMMMMEMVDGVVCDGDRGWLRVKSSEGSYGEREERLGAYAERISRCGRHQRW